jgi:DNA (cytosine-5)-methyltransferase 1
MIAGFPCQTFSVIGQRKGMIDERGQIIFHLIDILKQKNVKYFLLENVKGLINHDGGKSLEIILKSLNDAGYHVSFKVLNSLEFGVPQMRERIYFVGFRRDLVPENFEFTFPTETRRDYKLENYLTDDIELDIFAKEQAYKTFLKYLANSYNLNRFKITELLQQEFLVLDTRQSDLRLYKNKVPTLRLGRHGILYVKNKKFRKLSGYEALLLQGFPDNLAKKAKSKITDLSLLKQAGNAMTATTITEITKKIIESIDNPQINQLWQIYKQEVQPQQKMDSETKILF